MFEDGYTGDASPALLEAILAGYTGLQHPPGGNDPYVRVLHFQYQWKRERIAELFGISYPQISRILKSGPWAGQKQDAGVGPDYRAAYEAALVREGHWKDQAQDLRARNRQAMAIASALLRSHADRSVSATETGEELWDALR